MSLTTAARRRDDPLSLQASESHPAAAIGDRVDRQPAARAVRLAVTDDLREIEHDWRGFETDAVRTAFQSFDWLAKWQKHIGRRKGVRPVIVTGRDGNGRLVFIFPFAIEHLRMIRRLTWLGAYLCDYNGPLLAADFARGLSNEEFIALWRAILALIAADSRFRFDLVDLQKMPETIGGAPNPFLALATRDHPSGAYLARLTDDWDTFYRSRRSAATRKTERRQAKRLAEHGEIRFVAPTDPGERGDTLAALVAQKRATLGHMGAIDIFALPGHFDFYRDVATDPALQGLIDVCRLDVGAETGAASVALTLNGRYYLILSSYHGGALAHLGPGRAHLHELFRRAIANGFTLFDFTVGDEPYKHDWCDIEMRLCDHLAAATVRAWPAAMAVALFRRTKRFIKHTPVAWHAFTMARATAAALVARVGRHKRSA